MMKLPRPLFGFFFAFVGLMAIPEGRAQSGLFTVQVGAPPPAPVPIVNHGDIWRYRRGTNEPQPDWRTAADAALDATWLTGPGGFGYGDVNIQGEGTTISGMRNVHSSLYIRREFTLTNAIDSSAELRLRVDYDDGFVAYLDGAEITRRTVAGPPGSAVFFNTLSSGTHEASCCNSPVNPATTINLGSVSNRLVPGPHVLSFIALNDDINSSDLHIIADLMTVDAASGGVVNGGLFALTTNSSVTLSGTNTIVGSTRVTVNGDDSYFSIGNRTWTNTVMLKPGFNRLYLAALNASGEILTNVVRDVVYQSSAQFIGGTISTNATWNDPAVVVHVTNALLVSGATLEIGTGVVVLLSPNGSIIATNDGAVNIAGADGSPAVFLPEEAMPWGSLMAAGVNASLTIRHAEIVSGQVRALNAGTVLMEDSVARELPSGSREIVAAVAGGGLTLRRSRLERFTEIDSTDTPVLVEDCLLEGFFIDGLDIKSTNNLPLVVRSTTLRFASPTNGNADALDFGPGPGTVERCLIHDFPDKGVSIGGATGTSIRDTLIYNCGIGISAYASSNLVLVNNTVAGSVQGILFRDNPQPALGVATNLIVWGNTNNVVITNTSALAIQFSDLEGTNFPGPGNISSDPLFVNTAARDYRLAAGSPALGTGANGANMGAPFPIGGIPSQPLRLAALTPSTNYILLQWVDDADNDAGAIVQRSTDGAQWQTIASVAADATNYSDFTAQLDQPYYYRIRATNAAGVSAFSNPSRAVLAGPVLFAGGTLTGDTIWSGTVFVTNAVIVPGPFTLTISPGTIVRLTNNVGVTASGGGHIEVNGTREQPVNFDRVNTSFTRWGDLAATGSGSTVTVRHARITHGRVRASSNGTALVEDSELSQMTSSGIIGGSGGALFTVRRTYVHDYEDIDLVNTRTLAEDSLFERANSDIFELQSSPSGSVLRRCTFRNCLNPNSDGVDMNGCVGVLIDSCRIYNVTDKAISSGSATSASDPTSVGLVVSNTLIHMANIGIGIKDSGTAALFNNTISGVTDGVAVYAKFTAQGGYVTNGANNLIWAVTNAIRTTNGGTVTMAFSDLQGTNWPGPGNIRMDPLFLATALLDFRLATNSPAASAGQEGRDMGAHFPVGAPMALSHPRIESATSSNGVGAVQFWADAERSYTLQKADALNDAIWMTITNVPVRAVPAFIEVVTPTGPGNQFLRLQSP